jgi:AraC-like DNA-binding protein
LHVPDEPCDGASVRRADPERVRAWHPDVPGVAEVLHAHFVTHAYPAHTHDAWTLLIVDQGAIQFDLDHGQYGAITSQVTLLPPHVAHTGRAARDDGFRKRVVYLDDTVLGADLAGRAVAGPTLIDPVLRRRVSQLHDALVRSGDGLEAESRLSLIHCRLREHLRARLPRPRDRRARTALAQQLRELLDSRIRDGVTLREAGIALGAHPDHLVRAFTATFGLPPHRYLTGRRIDIARRRLLADHDIATVAVDVGFHDQAHFTRHFKAVLGTTPGRYVR